MHTLTLLAFALMLLLPAAAWGAGEDCTLCTGNWGPIATFSADCGNGVGNCAEAARAPDGDDHIIIPDGATVTVIADIAFTTAGSSLQIESGGSLIQNAATNANASVIHFYDGQDSIEVGGTSYDNVAFWTEAGSSYNGQCGYLKWGQATAAYATEVTEDNDTMWTVDIFSPCDEAAANIDAFDIGGDKDCDTGNQEYGFSIVYTDARNDPEAGCGTGCGDNYIGETLTHLATKNYDHYLICFSTGMEAGHCFPIIDGDIDATADKYAITLLLPQMRQGGAMTSLSYPLVDREQEHTTLEEAAAAGDTCIETVAGTLSADGEFVNACMYIYDTNGENGVHRPKRIMRTEDGEDCTGAAGADAWHFANDDPLEAAVADISQVVIAPTCIGQGDKYTIKAAVWLEMEEAGAWALGDSKALFEGDVRFRGVAVTGSALVLCEGSSCDWDVDDSVFWGGGADGTPVLKFQDTTNAIMSCSAIVGGSQTAGSSGIEFDGVTGLTHMSDVSTRYIAGPSFYAADSTMGTAIFERTSCERVGHIDSAIGDDCIDVGDDWETASVVDLFVGDWGEGNGSSIVHSTGTPVAISGVGIAGQTEGGLSHKVSTGVKATAVLARGIDTGRSNTAGGWTSIYLSHSDIRDFTLDGPAGYSLMSWGDVVFTDNYLSDISTDNYYLLNPNDFYGISDISRNVIRNATSTHADCDADGECAVVYVIADDDTADEGHVIEQNQIMWDEGEDTEFLSAFASDPTTGDTITFGGNAVFNMVNALANVAVIGIDFDAELAAGSTQRDLGGGNVLNNCVSYVEATDGTSTAEYVANAASFPVVPLLGIAPGFDEGGLVQRRNAFLRQQNCGAMIGPRKPGMPVGHSHLYMKMGIPEPERKPLVKYDEDGPR